MKIFKAAAAYFALVFGAGFLLGCIRVPFVVPHLGARYAELLEMPVQFVVIALAARYVVKRFAVPPDTSARLRVGLIALGLSLAAELSGAVALSGGALGAYIAGRDPVSGSVFLAMLVVFALFPLFLARMRPGGGRNG